MTVDKQRAQCPQKGVTEMSDNEIKMSVSVDGKTIELNGVEYTRSDLVDQLGKDADSLLVKNKNNGLSALSNQRVLLMCSNYFYEGILIYISDTDAILIDAAIVYDTGPWTEKKWKDRQQLFGPAGVKIHAIESYHQAPSLVV